MNQAKGSALVTGAGSGIGRGIAIRLGRDGYPVAVNDINGDAAIDTVKAIVSTGGRAIAAVGDVSNETDASRMVREARDAFGDMAVLVNNAGGGIIKPFLDHTPDTLRTTIDRNLWTTVWCTWHAVPIMKAKGYGRVVNIGADSVRNGLWDHAAQCFKLAGMPLEVAKCAREAGNDAVAAEHFELAQRYEDAAECFERLGAHHRAARCHLTVGQIARAMLCYDRLARSGEATSLPDDEVAQIVAGEVERAHRHAVVDQGAHHVGPDEAGGAGDQRLAAHRAHVISRPK